MYGSLGYGRGRFFCPKVAASIPDKGRIELGNAVDIAQRKGYKVIYGDTDSIMLNSGLRFENLDQKIHGSQTPQGRSDIDKIVKQC